MDDKVERPTARIGNGRGVSDASAETVGIILSFRHDEGTFGTGSCADRRHPARGGRDSCSNEGRSAPPRDGRVRNSRHPLDERDLWIANMQAVAGELFKFRRDKLQADRMGAIVGTPGLSHFA
ncbi:hypothetical protein ACQR1W_19620 [Bradyrhizobium sp. HKCCYLS1011]|uniref:hypothetical protein n=1 Tax=Bradyrhizobium sp. HKCCYLS1011 TaxID=3420733 RepID=UPI003EC0BC57